MFERAFLTMPETFTILHEPMGDPWYFGRSVPLVDAQPLIARRA
jgi:hypothetical protein